MPDQAFCFRRRLRRHSRRPSRASASRLLLSLIEDMNEPTIACNVPTVLMGSNVAGAPFDIITLDEHRADRPATPCLLNFGHRIGVLAGRRGVSTNDERLEGCRLAFAELGLTLAEESVEHANFSEDSAFEATCRFMPCKDRWTAIVSLSKLMTMRRHRRFCLGGNHEPPADDNRAANRRDDSGGDSYAARSHQDRKRPLKTASALRAYADRPGLLRPPRVTARGRFPPL